MATAYCGRPRDPPVTWITPAVARSGWTPASVSRSRPDRTQTTRELGSLRLSAMGPAGRTGELAGRVTALDWAGCMHITHAGPAPNRVRQRAASPQPPRMSGFPSLAEPPPLLRGQHSRKTSREPQAIYGERFTGTCRTGLLGRAVRKSGVQRFLPIFGERGVGWVTFELNGDERVNCRAVHADAACRGSR